MIDTVALKTSIIDLAVSGKISDQFHASDSVADIVAALPEVSKKRRKLLEQTFEYGRQHDIPSHWKWIRLGEIASYGDTPTKAFFDDVSGDTWILDLEDIKAGGSILTKTRVHGKKFVGDKTVFKAGQILYSKLRPYLKKVLVADEDGVSTPELISFDTYGGILPQYIVYCLLSSFTDRAIDKRSYGIKMPRVDAGFMVNLPIPLPPLSEQHFIVERVQAAFSQLDTIDALQAQYADNLTVLKTKLLEAAIQGKLTTQLPEDGTAEDLYRQIQKEKQALIQAGKIKKEKPLPENTTEEIPFEIPSNWKWVVLGNITSKISSGNTPTGGRNSDVYVPSGFPFFREQNIYDDGIHQAGMVFISESLLASRQNSTVKAKDILLNITGGSIGRCALVPDDFDRGSINQHILIIRAVVPETRHYLHMLICSPYVQSQIKNNAVGDKDGFSAGRCKRLLVPFPPLAEQKRIVQKIDEAMKVFEN